MCNPAWCSIPFFLFADFIIRLGNSVPLCRIMGSSSKLSESQFTVRKWQDKQCLERFSSRQGERWNHRTKVPVLGSEVMLQLSGFQHNDCPFAYLKARRSSKYLCSLTKSTRQEKLEGATRSLGRCSQIRYSYQEISGTEFKNNVESKEAVPVTVSNQKVLIYVCLGYWAHSDLRRTLCLTQ